MPVGLNTPCGRAHPERPDGRDATAPTAGGLHRLRAALIPLAIALYCIAIPGLLVGPKGAAGTVFVAMAALGAGLSLVGIAGRHRPPRLRHW